MAIENTFAQPAAGLRTADQWIYVFMAALFIVTAAVGFYPTSTGLLAGAAAGERPPIPLRLHIHAFLMVSGVG